MRVLHSPPLTSGTFPGPPVPFTPSPEAGPHLPTSFHTHTGPGNSRPWVWPASPHLRQWCPGMQAPGGAEEVLLLGSHWSYRVPTVAPAATLLTKLIGPQSFSSSTFCSATFSETPSTRPTGEQQLGKSPCKRPAPHTGVPPRRVRLLGAALGSGQGESAGRIARFQDAQQQKAIRCILHQPLRGTVN